MEILRSGTDNFDFKLAAIIDRGDCEPAGVESAVKEIVAGVREKGDAALVYYTEKFDRVALEADRLRVDDDALSAALESIPAADAAMLELASERIADFHRRQLQDSWTYTDGNGTVLGQKVTPLERVGIYVPGGKASYPSTVLMNAVPARVAGVGEVVMVTPPGGADGSGEIDPYVLAAARVAGVSAVYRVGGAQSIAALAYGTESVPRVDKIVGPGNIYVATAKRLVFGRVDIDMIAGPSEILIINDGSGDPAWMAADLLSQAEHDELASAILITTSLETAEAVAAEVETQLRGFRRREIASSSIENYGAVIVVDSLEEAVEISNRIAPEHLELFVDEPEPLLSGIRNAGAVFMGRDTPEALGDYLAGPNHTLPTGGTARFSSPLGAEDFIKKSSIISFSRKGFLEIGLEVERFAEIEGLYGHGQSARVRLRDKDKL